MPDEGDLAQMYGAEYRQFLSAEHLHSGEGGIASVIEVLRREDEGGVFLDYACGAGRLLKEAANAGWESVGVEFDAETASRFSEVHGLRIVSDAAELPADFAADVIHLGDVIEHLTDVNSQFPEVLRLLRDGGLVVAQGPLEANSNLFFHGIKAARRLRGAPPSTMPPYHVSLATAAGQRRFFERFGLAEMEFRVFETAHPAPQKIGFGDINNPRTAGLFALRKISQAATSLSRGRMGNRYYYVGRKV